MYSACQCLSTRHLRTSATACSSALADLPMHLPYRTTFTNRPHASWHRVRKGARRQHESGRTLDRLAYPERAAACTPPFKVIRSGAVAGARARRFATARPQAHAAAVVRRLRRAAIARVLARPRCMSDQRGPFLPKEEVWVASRAVRAAPGGPGMNSHLRRLPPPPRLVLGAPQRGSTGNSCVSRETVERVWLLSVCAE